jgi:hypothetical protein
MAMYSFSLALNGSKVVTANVLLRVRAFRLPERLPRAIGKCNHR